MIKLIASQVTIDAAAGETGRREITGIAVPYGVAATVADGTSVIFEQGSLPVEGKAPRLYMNHDATNAIGIVTERVDTPEGMMFTAKISKTQAGDEALILAMDGVLDSVSVGVNPIKYTTAKDGTVTVTAADWIELSLVPVPAFAGAIITDIAASIPQDEPEISTIETEPTQETEPMSEATIPAVEATIPTAPIFAQAKRKFAMPSAGEYLAAMHAGGDTFHNVNAAYKEAVRDQQTALQAAAGDILTTDTPGLLPVPVLGPVFQDLNFVRPVVTAFGARSMPNTPSKTFVRPTITTHTSAATQTEGSAVSATTMVIASNTVTKSTVAGQVTMTMQDMDFTDPASMNIVLNDLAGEYLIKTDDIAADALVATTAVEARTKDVPTITATPTRRFLRAIIRALLGENRLLSVFIDLLSVGMVLISFLAPRNES
jgi:HK97 family phage prohead protease